MDYIDSFIKNFNYFDNNTIYKWYNFIIINFGIYIAWICIHYIASHMYVTWCLPFTIAGFVLSPFLIPAPHCYGLRWIIYNGGNSIVSMWALLSTWLVARIIPIKMVSAETETSTTEPIEIETED
tara:strand:+ start:764 stop:1138 length:375 start_codon:yes stop_codon:yes gene_type:complete